MVAVRNSQVPPWEISSRISYRRWKDRNNKRVSGFKSLYNSFKSYQKLISEFTNTHTHQLIHLSKDHNAIKTFQDKINPYIGDICIRLQQLAHSSLNNHQNKLCVDLINSIDDLIAYIPTETIFKILVSYSRVVNSLVSFSDTQSINKNRFSLKVKSHQICKKLFDSLETRGFEVNQQNILTLIDSYIRLCCGYGEDSEFFSKIYKDSIQLITSSKVSLDVNDLDKLLLIYDRMGIYDKDYIIFYSNTIRKYFTKFTENQIGNFCRYMTKIPFVESKQPITHIDLLKPKTDHNDSDNALTESVQLRYVKRLPRYYLKALLNRRSYRFTPKIDYSSCLTEDRQKEVLRGWNFKNSSFTRALNRALPFVLHKYSYFNLIDIAEMYYIYDIKSNILPRFSTELWKYLYTLKYGYPLKSLIVLSCLKQGDAITYGRLIRNIPSTLCFTWYPELVAEGLIACGRLGIKKLSVYNKLSGYLEKRILYFSNPNLICRIFESLSLANVPQYGIYYQLLNLVESFPDWLHLKHLILIAKSCSIMGMLENRLFRALMSKMDQISSCTVGEIIPIIKLSREISLNSEDSANFYKFLLYFLRSIDRNDCVTYDDFIDLLEGMVSMQARTTEVEHLSLKVLKCSKELNLIKNDDIVKIIKYFSILGKIESRELIDLLGNLVDENLSHFEEFELSSLIWDMISVGFTLDSPILLKVVKKFNQLKPKILNTHLLSVVSVLVRLSGYNGTVWKEFVRIVDGYKDFSWHSDTENMKIIKSVANTIKNSRTFVQQFPYTIDITAHYKNIDNTHMVGSNIDGEFKGNGDELERYDEKNGSDGENDLALFYYKKQENPFILHINPDGKKYSRVWDGRTHSSSHPITRII